MKMVIKICGCLLLVLILVSSRFVWIPDAFSGRIILLDSIQTVNGETLRLEQFWNGSDFYTLKLDVQAKDGVIRTVVLDGDSAKVWRARLSSSDDGSLVRVKVDGDELAVCDLSRNEAKLKRGTVLLIQ